MSGIEIFGAIAAAIGLTTNLVRAFGTRRNAPRQIDRLQGMLEELRDVRLIATAEEPEQRKICDMINRCTDLLQQNGPDGHGRRKSILPWKFHWPADVEEQLRLQNDEISQELTRLQTRIYRPGGVGGLSPSPASPVLIPGQFSPESMRRATLSHDMMLPAPRRGSNDFIDLPAILHLQKSNGNPVLDPLRLFKVNVLERDESSRTILYESRIGDPKVAVTHRVPRGTDAIRFEDDDLDDTAVSFLDAHDFTIHNSEGYKIYRSHSVYEFKSQDSREQFLCKLRERVLLGRYYAKKILRDGEVIAQAKVVQFWLKASVSLVTLAFLGRGGTQFELRLSDMVRSPKCTKRLVITYNPTDRAEISFEFRTNDDAKDFKAAFESHHPSTWDNARLLPALTPSSLLSTELQSLMINSPTASSSVVTSSSASMVTTATTVSSGASLSRVRTSPYRVDESLSSGYNRPD